MADAIATEARAKNRDYTETHNGDSANFTGLTFWTPNINIFRDPRWGRGQETYGEDPFLTGRLAVAFIHGLAGRRSEVFEGDGLRETFRGAQRAGIVAAPVQRGAAGARFLRDLSAAF